MNLVYWSDKESYPNFSAETNVDQTGYLTIPKAEGLCVLTQNKKYCKDFKTKFEGRSCLVRRSPATYSNCFSSESSKYNSWKNPEIKFLLNIERESSCFRSTTSTAVSSKSRDDFRVPGSFNSDVPTTREYWKICFR